MSADGRIVQISVSTGGVSKRRVYARVLREGTLATGDPVRLLAEVSALALPSSPAR